MGLTRRMPGVGLLLAAVLLTGALPGMAPGAVVAGGHHHGRLAPAPRLATQPRVPSGPRVSAIATGAIDTSDRDAVAAAYRDTYLALHDVAQGWTGSVGSCQRGSVNAAYVSAVTGLVNYFRNLAGLPDVTTAPSLNSLDQAAALIMDANDTLTHSPTSDLDCYTSDGYQGASHSNLCFGCIGPTAIDAYMWDFGGSNTAAGHRRWILYPPQTILGTGSTTQADGLYVLDTGSWLRPADAPDWVSWPPAGFVPDAHIYPRFSLSHAGAGFGSATVSVTIDGSSVAAPVVSRVAGYGDPAIVFEVDTSSVDLTDGDHVFHVSVSGVDVDGSAVDHDWVTTSIVPPPAAPAAVAATAIADTEVRLTWHDGLGEDGYRIRRDDGSPPWPVVGTVGWGGTSFTDDGLTPETAYSYEVCAWSGPSESCSAPVSATTLPAGTALPLTVVLDDRDAGFDRAGSGWHRQSAGYRKRSFWSTVRRSGTRQIATWTAALHAPGSYQVWVRVPANHATTRSATYRVTTAGGTATRTISQKAVAGTWTLLGTWSFDAVAVVRLTDRTGEAASTGRTLVADVIRVVPAP